MSNKVFKISLSAVYNNENIEPEIIADQLFAAMQSIGNGLVMININSIKKVNNTNKEIMSILKDISNEPIEQMVSKNDESGEQFIEINKSKNKTVAPVVEEVKESKEAEIKKEVKVKSDEVKKTDKSVNKKSSKKVTRKKK